MASITNTGQKIQVGEKFIPAHLWLLSSYSSDRDPDLKIFYATYHFIHYNCCTACIPGYAQMVAVNCLSKTITMSLKKLSKTHWKMEPNRVTIYPFGRFFIVSAVLALFFAGILVLYVNYAYPSKAEAVSLALFLLFITLVFSSFGSIMIQFDNHSGLMRKKMLSGLIPLGTVPLRELQGIEAVSNLAGTYSYKMFKKNGRYGKGVTVTSSFSKNDDPNAIAFVNEVVPVIHGYLDQHEVPGAVQETVLTSYQYFTGHNAAFEMKNKKTGSIIFGLLFIGLGVWVCTIKGNSVWSTIFMGAVIALMGLAFIHAAFTKIIISTPNQTVQKIGLLGLGNKHYNFSDFAGFQVVRKSVNFSYAGTEIRMLFDLPNKTKQEVFLITTLRKSDQIERFLQELNQIMALAPAQRTGG